MNDPKGELYKKTAGYAQQKGYKVYVLNLRDVTRSHGWNPLMLIRSYKKIGKIPESEQALGDLKEAMTADARATTNDVYWADMAGEVIKYCTLLLEDSVPDQYFNIANLIQMTNENNHTSLKNVLGQIDQSTNAAISMHAVLDLEAEKTKSCVYSCVKQMLIPFTENRLLRDILGCNEIDFEDLVTGKTVIYVIYPDEKSSLNFLVNLFFTQCYQYIIDRSSAFEDNMLPTRVNFVLDEFANLTKIQNFENRISEARGHNVRYFLFAQAFGQLKSKYGDNAETIIANCDWIIFPSKDIQNVRQHKGLLRKRAEPDRRF